MAGYKLLYEQTATSIRLKCAKLEMPVNREKQKWRQHLKTSSTKRKTNDLSLKLFFLFHISTIIAVGQYKYNSVEQITLIGTNSENW